MSRVHVVGSVALDTIEGPAGKAENVLGGSATYATYSASFFGQASLIACVGEDFPADALKVLGEKGTDLTGLKKLPGKTFRWTGRYAPGFVTRDTLHLDLGVFLQFNPTFASALPAGDFLLLGNIDPDLQLKVLAAAGPGVFVAADTIDHWIKTKRDALLQGLKRTDLFFLNNEEAELLTGEANLMKAGKALRALGPKLVVIKKGEHGALLFGPDGLAAALPAFPLETVADPTGAGDVFAGATLGYLAKVGKRDPDAVREAMARATIMSSYAVEAFGVDRLRKLQLADVESRLATLRRLVSF